MNPNFTRIGRLLAVVLFSSVNCLAVAQPAQRIDGELFLRPDPKGDTKQLRITSDPKSAQIKDGEVYLGLEGNSKAFDLNYDAADGKSTVFERNLGRWKDPFSLPHSRAECVKWASGDIPFDGSWKTCVGHKVQFRWIYNTAVLRVDVIKPAVIRDHVEECLRGAGAVSALAGISTAFLGNPNAVQTAIATFTTVMKVCLATKIPDLANVAVDIRSSRGDWE